MAIFHVATSTPTKAELIERWIPTQTWGPAAGADIELVGSFHFDDPEGRVGMETHLATVDGTVFQVPLTYRDTPLDGDAADALIGTMEHSALGTRWVYDGLRDDRYRMVLAGAALTGQGQALGMATHEGRWYAAPSNVRITGGGWRPEPVAIDGFELTTGHDAGSVTLRNERFEMRVARRPTSGPRPAVGLTATWGAHHPGVVLVEIEPL